MEQEYEKDYGLLRPFDLAAAKRGELICWYNSSDSIGEYIGPHLRARGQVICVRWLGDRKNVRHGDCDMHQMRNIRMAPQAWVEGKPVYVEVDNLEDTPSVAGGFGSTGNG